MTTGGETAAFIERCNSERAEWARWLRWLDESVGSYGVDRTDRDTKGAGGSDSIIYTVHGEPVYRGEPIGTTNACRIRIYDMDRRDIPPIRSSSNRRSAVCETVQCHNWGAAQQHAHRIVARLTFPAP